MSFASSVSDLDLIIASMGSIQPGGAEALERRLENLARRLKDSGSIFLVVEWELAYAVRRVADRVFGAGKNLRNEIIWVTRRARAVRGFTEQHHTVLWYVKDPELAPFERLMMPRSIETRKRFGNGRIVSAISPRTGRRAPTRVEGASMEAPLNDVWVWDQDRCAWVFELEEMDGRVFAHAPFAASAVGASGDEALCLRLTELAGASRGSSERVRV